MKDFLSSVLPLCTVPGDHSSLWTAVYEAQRASAYANPSLSKMLVNLVGQSSQSFIRSLTAGFQSVGPKHGPIGEARDDLDFYDAENIKPALDAGMKIHGFGSSFYKKEMDPNWKTVANLLLSSYPAHWARVATIQATLHGFGRRIYPNPAGLSAAACNATGFPRGLEEAIFVMPRMQVWLDEYIKTLDA
jgi:citrate synthase